MTGCTQRGCAGTIVDGYCDVCGSPAGAPPFIPAVAAASASSPALAGRTGLTASGRGWDFSGTEKLYAARVYRRDRRRLLRCLR